MLAKHYPRKRILKYMMTALNEISDKELESLHGKSIIVTGGASGIGKAVVLIAHGMIKYSLR